MAKKARTARNSGAAARTAKSKAAGRSVKKKPGGRRSSTRQSALGRPARFAKRKRRKSARRSAAIRRTVDGYVATLNGWRKQCVAQLRRIMRGVELPDPRKLLKDTGKKMRRIKLRDLKEAGLKEWQELVRLASSLNEIKRRPARRARPVAKRK